MQRICGEPHRLLEGFVKEDWSETRQQSWSILSGAASGLGGIARSAGCAVCGTWNNVAARFDAGQCLQDKEEDEGGSKRRDEGGIGVATTSSSSSSATAVCANRLKPSLHHRDRSQTTMVDMPSDKGAMPIKTYLFSDEGKNKGLVKVYIQAKDLEGHSGFAESVAEVTVRFHEHSLYVRAVSTEGHVFILDTCLYGAVYPKECKYTRSSTGHKVTITLKKVDATTVWQKLQKVAGSSQNGFQGVRDERDFL